MAQIDDNGVTSTTLQEYKTQIETGYLDIDPDWNIEPESPDGSQIAIWSEVLANLDEKVVYTYQSLDPLTAVGQSLDRIASISGIQRQSGESDAVFRVRRNNSVAQPGSNQIDSIYADIANVSGVENTRIYENYESTTDSNGLNPHSIAILVKGGDDDDIASSIANNKSPGCGLNAGNSFDNKVQVYTQTTDGNPFTATFYRPVETDIFVEVNLVDYTGDISLIQQAIVDYANAALFDSSETGFDKTGFDIGELIVAGKLYTPTNNILSGNGYVSSIYVGTDMYDVTYNIIDVGFNGLGIFDIANITINVS